MNKLLTMCMICVCFSGIVNAEKIGKPMVLKGGDDEIFVLHSPLMVKFTEVVADVHHEPKGEYALAYVIRIVLQSGKTEEFKKFSSQNMGKTVSLVLEGEVLATTIIHAPINTGSFEISFVNRKKYDLLKSAIFKYLMKMNNSTKASPKKATQRKPPQVRGQSVDCGFD